MFNSHIRIRHDYLLTVSFRYLNPILPQFSKGVRNIWRVRFLTPVFQGVVQGAKNQVAPFLYLHY